MENTQEKYQNNPVDNAKSIQLGINGFGRIGRLIARVALTRNGISIAAINDPFLDAASMAYLLQYDSVHGRFPMNVTAKDNSLIIDNRICIPVFNSKEPNLIPWTSCNVQVIAECSGVNLTQEKCQVLIK